MNFTCKISGLNDFSENIWNLGSKFFRWNSGLKFFLFFSAIPSVRALDLDSLFCPARFYPGFWLVSSVIQSYWVLKKPLIGPYAAQLGLAGQFFLAGESSVWSPFFLPLFAAIQYYKNEINQMDNLTFFAGLLPMSTMGTFWWLISYGPLLMVHNGLVTVTQHIIKHSTGHKELYTTICLTNLKLPSKQNTRKNFLWLHQCSNLSERFFLTKSVFIGHSAMD